MIRHRNLLWSLGTRLAAVRTIVQYEIIQRYLRLSANPSSGPAPKDRKTLFTGNRHPPHRSAPRAAARGHFPTEDSAPILLLLGLSRAAKELTLKSTHSRRLGGNKGMSEQEKTRRATPAEPASDRLNQSCFCVTLDRRALRRAFERETGDAAFCATLLETHPHLFSNVAVFASTHMFERMLAVVRAVEVVSRLPAYRDAVLSWAPDIAGYAPGPVGAFMGYDFHIEADGPKLIEVNTNAGGAFLTAPLAQAQRSCCADAGQARGRTDADQFEPAVLHMFQEEWSRQGRSGTPKCVAIVDDDPEAQYLYPEFVLARRFFERHGIEAVVADGRHLFYDQGTLQFESRPIDLVYNRLVDFALAQPEHAALKSAYLDDAVVVTPNPRAHALLADKRNLTLLSDPEQLRQLGAGSEEVGVLMRGVPPTIALTPDNADELWKKRKRFFFKPAGGHGGKAAYRGDKITKSVWAQITTGSHVAQAFAAPGERAVRVDQSSEFLKADVRLYTYAGDVLLAAARLYQGQTTNFRTQGGGFAPVFQV